MLEVRVQITATLSLWRSALRQTHITRYQIEETFSLPTFGNEKNYYIYSGKKAMETLTCL